MNFLKPLKKHGPGKKWVNKAFKELKDVERIDKNIIYIQVRCAVIDIHMLLRK